MVLQTVREASPPRRRLRRGPTNNILRQAISIQTCIQSRIRFVGVFPAVPGFGDYDRLGQLLQGFG